MNEEKMAKEPCERIHRSRGEIMLNNFLGGLAWSLGTLIGATILIAVVSLLLAKVDLIPIIGSWISQVIHEVALKNPNLLPK